MTTNEYSYEELEPILQDLYPTIRRAARSVAFQWPGVVEEDDVEQSIATHLWERPGSLVKVSQMEDRPQYRAIVGIGHQIASQERTDYDYYKGSYRYGVDEVKSLLKRGVLIEPVDGFYDAVFDLMEGLEAMWKRNQRYVDSIVSRYADLAYPSSGADKKRLSDALTELTNEMNKSNKRRYVERDDGPGTRTVLTRAEAQAISQAQYGGAPEEGDEYSFDYDEAVNFDRYSTGGYR